MGGKVVFHSWFPLWVVDCDKEYLSSKHPDINCFIEREIDGCLPFVVIYTTDMGIYQLQKFYTKTFKIGLLSHSLFGVSFYALFFSSWIYFYEADTLKSIVYENIYPCYLDDKCVK